jgi:hypothetical protein
MMTVHRSVSLGGFLHSANRGWLRAVHTSLRAIAAELTARGIRTRRGGVWGVSNVKALFERLGSSKK